MSRGTVTSLVLALALLRAQPAAAWDPFADEPFAADPLLDPSPVVDPAPVPDPLPFVVPDGLYLVTDVYAGDVVTSSGTTTTYATTTTQQIPGTFARVIDTVATGGTSQFDGASFNGRAALPDGRAVAGTYYQDFVLTADGFVAVNIVFFQDDSVTVPAFVPTPLPVPAPSVPPPAIVPPDPTFTPAPVPPPAPPAPIPPAPIPPAPAGPVEATAAVALAPAAPALASIEVLRGRRIALWPRIYANGASVPVRGWRLVSGGADVVSARSGTGAEPCEVLWLTLPPAGASWTLRFEVTSDAVPGRVATATIEVIVRSPALEQ